MIPLQRSLEKKYMVSEEESSELLYNAAECNVCAEPDQALHQVMASLFLPCNESYHHTHHGNAECFLLIPLKIRGEIWGSKAKGDKMSYFFGYSSADKKLMLIKPTLKSFQSM